MTDPDETASIVGEITAALREHQAEEAARHPVTYHEASTGNIVDQMARYRDLDQHDALAGAIAIGKARGTYVPNEHVNEAEVPAADRRRAPGDAGARRADRPVLPAPVAGRQGRQGRGQLGSDRGRYRDHGGRRPGRLPGVG